MHDTGERIKRVKWRIRKLQSRSENRMIKALTFICITLSFSLVGLIADLTGGGWASVSGLYATVLLYEDAGGYVLVALISFTLAVIITILGLRYREDIKRVAINKDEVKE